MRSSPTPARATASTFSIATSSPARTAGSSASSAAASSSAGTRRSPSPPPKRRSCIRSASSPASAIEAMIPATTSRTAAGAGSIARTRAAIGAAVSRPTGSRSIIAP